MTAMQSNVLMVQIRAEKTQHLHERRTPLAHASHKETQGKKIFREILYRPSLSPSQKENSPKNCFRADNRDREFKATEAHRSRSAQKKALQINNDHQRKNLGG